MVASQDTTRVTSRPCFASLNMFSHQGNQRFRFTRHSYVFGTQMWVCSKNAPSGPVRGWGPTLRLGQLQHQNKSRHILCPLHIVKGGGAAIILCSLAPWICWRFCWGGLNLPWNTLGAQIEHTHASLRDIHVIIDSGTTVQDLLVIIEKLLLSPVCRFYQSCGERYRQRGIVV